MYKEGILLAIGHEQLENYLISQLENEYDFIGIALYREAVMTMIEQKNPKILIIRETLKGKIPISKLIYEIRVQYSDIRVIFVAGNREPGDALLASLVNVSVYDILIGQSVNVHDIIRLVREPNKHKDVAFLQPIPIIDEETKQLVFESPQSQAIIKEEIKEIYIETENPNRTSTDEEVEYFEQLKNYEQQQREYEEQLRIYEEEQRLYEERMKELESNNHFEQNNQEMEQLQQEEEYRQIQQEQLLQEQKLVEQERLRLEEETQYYEQQRLLEEQRIKAEKEELYREKQLYEEQQRQYEQQKQYEEQQRQMFYQEMNHAKQEPYRQTDKERYEEEQRQKEIMEKEIAKQERVRLEQKMYEKQLEEKKKEEYLDSKYEEDIHMDENKERKKQFMGFFSGAQMNPKMSVGNKIITFVGSKAGVGNTSVALSVAVYLAETNHKVLFVEYDPSEPSSNYWFNIGHANHGIDTALRSLEKYSFNDIEDSIIRMEDIKEKTRNQGNPYKTIPSTLDFFYFSKKYLSKIFEPLTTEQEEYTKELFLYLLLQADYDYIILDVPHEQDSLVSLNAVLYSHKIFMTITPDIATIGYANTKINEWIKKGVQLSNRMKLIVNRFEKTKLSIKHIQDLLEIDDLNIVPELNKEFIVANYDGVPLVIQNKVLKNHIKAVVKDFS